jgi:HAD superfamily hydrolase (TIGR01509 family)
VYWTAMIAAIIFDFDGLILDTELPGYRSWTEAFEGIGVPPLSAAEWSVQIGTVGPLDPLAELAARAATAGLALEAAAIGRLDDRRRQRRDELLGAETVRPGVVAWIDAAAARGLALAVASSSPRDWVEAHLDRLGLLSRFGALACHGDHDRLAAKPEPDLYLEACQLLGVAPTAAVAVEDSPNGVRAAKAAGLACVAVPNDLTRLLDLDQADLVVESLAAVTLDEALEALAG